MNKTIKLKRVPYAKPNTLDEDKEYQLFGASPFGTVGTLREWRKSCPDVEIIIVDKNGEKIE